MTSKIMIGVPYLEDIDIVPNGQLKGHVGQGKPVVVMVQGNFCGYCTQAKPDFQRFSHQSKDVVGVTVQMDGAPADQRAAKLLSSVNNSPGVPAYLGFNSKGQFVAMHNGNRDLKSLQQFASTLN